MQSIPAIVLASAAAKIAQASDRSADTLLEKERRLRIDQKFLLFPINNESSSRHVQLVKNGRVLRSFTASLGLPAQWWGHLDVSEWYGQTLTLAVAADTSPATEEIKALGRGANETHNAELIAAVRTSADIWSPETIYKEPLRPAFHFSAKRGWNNDPNGLMYYAASIICFFSTIRMEFAGGTCTGDMQSAPISSTGKNSR